MTHKSSIIWAPFGLFMIGICFYTPVYGDGMAPEQVDIIDIAPGDTDLSTLTTTAAGCRGAIDRLWEKRVGLPTEKHRHFDISIGRASVHCDMLQKQMKLLENAKTNVTGYNQSIYDAGQTLQ